MFVAEIVHRASKRRVISTITIFEKLCRVGRESTSTDESEDVHFCKMEAGFEDDVEDILIKCHITLEALSEDGQQKTEQELYKEARKVHRSGFSSSVKILLALKLYFAAAKLGSKNAIFHMAECFECILGCQEPVLCGSLEVLHTTEKYCQQAVVALFRLASKFDNEWAEEARLAYESRKEDYEWKYHENPDVVVIGDTAV